jgi:hypothetical protein
MPQFCGPGFAQYSIPKKQRPPAAVHSPPTSPTALASSALPASQSHAAPPSTAVQLHEVHAAEAEQTEYEQPTQAEFPSDGTAGHVAASSRAGH